VSPTIAASLAQYTQQMKGEIDDGTIFWRGSRPESGSLRRAVHKLSQQNTSASSGNFQPTSTQKRNGCAKKAYLGTGDRTTLTSTGPLHPSDFALRLKAPQQSAHLRRVEQYCSARQVLPLLLPRPDLLISLVVIYLLLVRPFLSSPSFLPLVVAFDITVSEL